MRETRWYKVINIAQLDSYPMLFSLKTKFCEFTSEYNRGHKWGSWKRHLFLWKSLAWVSDPECRRHVFMIGQFVSADQKKVRLIYFNEHCPNFVTFWDHVRRKTTYLLENTFANIRCIFCWRVTKYTMLINNYFTITYTIYYYCMVPLVKFIHLHTI